MDTIVDITDVRWPSLREAARRFLREDGCTLSVPEHLIEEAWQIVQKISDHVPEKLNLPSVVTGDLRVIGLAQIGGKEPTEDICWVPNSNWDEFSAQVLDLLSAGYPGCVGCGGPGAEGVWNELARREEIQQQN